MFQKLRNILNKPSVKSIILITVLMFIAKSFGFVRSVQLYSNKEYADVFSNPQRIQSLLVSILVAGTIISTITPTGTKILNEYGQKALNIYFRMHFWIISVFFFLISLIMYFFTETILNSITKPLIIDSIKSLGAYDDFINSGKLIVFGVVFFAIHSVFVSYLSIKSSFFYANLTGIITSAFTVFAIWYFNPNYAFFGNLFLLLGLILGCIITFFASVRSDLSVSILNPFLIQFKSKESSLVIREVWNDYRSMIPKTLLIPIPMLVLFLLNTKYQDLGDMTNFDTAENITGIFGAIIAAMGMVLLPKLSHTLFTKSHKAMVNQIDEYMAKIIPLSFVGVIITFLGGEYILKLIKILGKGQSILTLPYYQLPNSDLTTLALVKILAICLVFSSINEVLSKYYLIKNKIYFMIFGNLIASGIVFGIIYQNFVSVREVYLAAWAFVIGLGFLSIWYYLGIKLDKANFKQKDVEILL
jgi:peptidoglycan biosynthesis protein MviN/MurJ (putative lipid II flippase)